MIKSIRSTRLLSLIAATLSLLGAAAPGQAAPGDPLVPVFLAYPQPTPYQSQPALARNALGNFIVAWRDDASQALFARRYATNGAPLDDGFQVSPAGETQDSNPAVAIDAKGNFVVTWLRGASVNAQGDVIGTVMARGYDRNGVAIGNAFAVQDAQARSYDGAPRAAADGKGRFVLAWYHVIPLTTSALASSAETQIRARRFTLDGTAVDAKPLIAATRTTSSISAGGALLAPLNIGLQVDVATDPKGEFVIAWRSAGEVAQLQQGPQGTLLGGGKYEIRTQRFDSAGVKRSGIQVPALKLLTAVALGGAGFGHAPDLSVPVLAMNSDGSFIVAWTQRDTTYQPSGSTSSTHIRARQYDASGSAADVTLDAGKIGLANDDAPLPKPAISSDGLGNFVLAFETATKTTAGPLHSQIGYRRFAAPGLVQGTAITLLGAKRPNQYAPAIAEDGLGNFAITWSEKPSNIATQPGPVVGQLYSGQ